MNFREEYEKRLRRVCDVNDDTLQVSVDSETQFYGHCSECDPSAYVVLKVTVYTGKVGEPVGRLLSDREFYNLDDLNEALFEVEV